MRMLWHPLLLFLEVLTIAKLDHQLNEEIRDKEVRLIGADGAQLGIMSSTQANDLNTKIKAASKFLADGNRVKVSVRFRGREMAHTNIGEKLLMDFAEACAEVASMEKNPKLEGRFMAMFLTPKNSK